MRLGRLVSYVLAAGTLLVPAPAAGAPPPIVKKASAAGVRAELSYRNARYYTARDVRLTIVRRGETVYARSLRRRDRPTGLRVRDLDGDKEPEVVADFYTGGAHCCWYSLIHRYDTARTSYRPFKHEWGNQGYRLLDVGRDGTPEFVSQDDAFAYAFTAYAASFYPIRIWQLKEGKMVLATRRFPGLIRRDAARLWREYVRIRKMRPADVRGVLAAYLADKYLLGQQAQGWRRVRAAYARGELRAGRGDPWPAGRRYLRGLRRFLVRAGYARR